LSRCSLFFPYTTLFRSRISDDDRCVKSKGVVNCLAYPFRDCGRIFCLGLKDDVSTLNVRLDIPKAKTSAQFAKMVHLDYFLSARSEEHTSELQSRFDLV